MNLYLFRHAPADPADPREIEALGEPTADARRPLSARGRERFAEAVRGVGALGIGFDALLYSPWRRAVETADLLRPLLAGRARVCGALAGPPGDALWRALAGEHVAAVGHEPWLGQAVGMLLGAGEAPVAWKRGGLVWLEGEARPGGMRVRAVLPPKVLRAVAR